MQNAFFTKNDLLSQKKETELKRLQTPNLELKFEVKVKLQGLNPHPIFHVSKIELKTSPAPFEVVHNEFERDLIIVIRCNTEPIPSVDNVYQTLIFL